ncbi:MAG TPA: nitrile hydratase subunit alpha, partial [Gammaproteobacteria bacterium]|nr:nitrile hydratase subunit alpha [Gammaproteobacteria bacterium]
MSDESPQAIRAEALESILIEKGLITAEAVDDIITRYSERVGPMNGARLVARAWADPQFKKQLLTDATSIVESFGF